MSRRFQFSVRAVFVVTTLAAVAVAACQSLARIWDSFFPLAALLLMAIPLLLLPAVFSAILPFVHRKAVREIADREQRRGTEGKK